MPRIAWYKKESNIVNMSSCIRQNNIVLFNREDVNKICLALNLSPKKVVDGKFVHADQIRTMYLRAYDYFKSHHIEKTSNNYASFMIWKYTKTKKDKTVHKEAIKSFEVITKNIYLCNKPRSMAIDADICSCSIEEKCKITSSCINR